MNNKIVLSFLLIVSIVNFAYLWVLNYKINTTLEEKQWQLDSIYEEIHKIAMNKQSSDVMNNNSQNQFVPNDIFDSQFDTNLFDMEKRMNERMESLFKDTDEKFGMNFDLNLVPKGWNYMNFSNTTTINWKKYSYSIRVSWESVDWEVISEDSNKLNELEKSLKDLQVETKLKWDKLTFSSDKVDYKELLKLFDINASINSNNNSQNNSLQEKEWNVF